MAGGPHDRRAVRIAVVVLVALGAICARVALSGQAALERGRANLQAGDAELAGLDLREAIGWTLPGWAPWRGEAIALLWDLQGQQAARGEVPEAVATLTALRAGLYASRSLLVDDDAEHARVDAALAPLMARWEELAASAEGRRVPGSAEEREIHFAATLARDRLPDARLGILAVIGFALWVGATLRATARTGRRRWAHFGAALVGFAAFLAGVALA